MVKLWWAKFSLSMQYLSMCERKRTERENFMNFMILILKSISKKIFGLVYDKGKAIILQSNQRIHANMFVAFIITLCTLCISMKIFWFAIVVRYVDYGLWSTFHTYEFMTMYFELWTLKLPTSNFVGLKLLIRYQFFCVYSIEQLNILLPYSFRAPNNDFMMYNHFCCKNFSANKVSIFYVMK